MAKRIYVLVEGDGEEKAVPYLTRRILHEYFERYDFSSIEAYCAHGRGTLTVKNGLEKFLELMRRKSDCSGCLILIDAEAEYRFCPLELVLNLVERTRKLNLSFPVVVVCAVCEYESWFLVNLERISASFFETIVEFEGNPEEECSAKGWIARHMPVGRTYKETLDQEKMTSMIDLRHTAKLCRSFQRLIHAIEELISAIDSKTVLVSPSKVTL